MSYSKYCPYCQRDIEPSKDEFGNVIGSEYEGFIYVHDAVLHDDDYDFEELQ